MVNSRFHVQPLDIWSFRADVQGWVEKFGEYFRVLVSPEIESKFSAELAAAPNVTRIPTLSFSAYHPDCTYAGGASGMLNGPMDAYHSIIILAAFNSGLSAKDAEGLFRGEVYERVGFTDYWIPQRDRLVESFSNHGYDISNEIRRWGRHEAWMHTIDHPKMPPIYDVARAIMRSMGVEDEGARVLPEDNLTKGCSWAVYPEIGEAVGVPGSLRFKKFNDYRHIGLPQLIREFYTVYEQEPAGSVHTIAEARSAYNRVLEAIG